jgi:hypothetical protein
MFPQLPSTRWGDAGTELAVLAMAAAGVRTGPAIDDLAEAVARLNLSRLREGLPQEAGAGPLAQRAMQLLLSLARAGRPGAEVAASLVHARHPAASLDADALSRVAAEPVDIEHRPAVLAALQQALQGRLDEADFPAERRPTDAQVQIIALAIFQTCGVGAGAQVARTIVGYDWCGAMVGGGSASNIDLLVQRALRGLVLAGGEA